jgi:hypothetical protein
MMRSAIVAFQFYDKLTQRLGHVNGSMTVALADLIADPRRLVQSVRMDGHAGEDQIPLHHGRGTADV